MSTTNSGPTSPSSGIYSENTPPIPNAPPSPVPSVTPSVTSTGTRNDTDLKFFPLYDAFLDIPHPSASTTSNVNLKRLIVAPPKASFHLSRDVGVELATENGLQHVSAFCFPDHYQDPNASAQGELKCY